MRCKRKCVCSQCQSPDCGECNICCIKKLSGSRSRSGTGRCYQTMCQCIPVSQKSQACDGLLPANWLFYFDRDGLFIFETSLFPEVPRKLYKSFEAASTKFPEEFKGLNARPFYGHVGLLNSKRASMRRPQMSDDETLSPASSLEYVECQCYNCSRGPCKRCSRCIVGEIGYCSRRICCNIPCNLKMQQFYLPPEWKYTFDPAFFSTKKSRSAQDEKLDGFVLISPTGQAYPSIEDAMIHHPTTFREDIRYLVYNLEGLDMPDDRDSFWAKKKQETLIGHSMNGSLGNETTEQSLPNNKHKRQKTASLDVEEDQASAGSSSNLRLDFLCGDLEAARPNEEDNHRIETKRTSCKQAHPNSKSSHNTAKAHNAVKAALKPSIHQESNDPNSILSKLHRRRCGDCDFCLMPPCQECKACVMNSSRTRTFREACIQRICLSIVPENERRLKAKGFPDGWQFCFMPEDTACESDHEELRGLRLISPKGMTYNSIDAARRQYPKQLRCLSLQPFCEDTGIAMLKNAQNDILLNKIWYAQWISIAGKRAAWGTIVKVQIDQTYGIPTKMYIVEYCDDDSTMNGGDGQHIHKTIVLKPNRAWSGCLAYEAFKPTNNRILSEHVPLHNTWITPSVYRRYVIPNPASAEDGIKELPRLQVQYGIFLLEFSVKKSTIPNAGKGVFLACKAWDIDGKTPTHFELQPGKLLDFGVYAPIRPDDRRDNFVFLMKNFIHRFRCEDYSFSTNDPAGDDTIFDITDDVTGDLHDEARRHVTPYVNEIGPGQTANVLCEYDCEGGMHYLLGHAAESRIPFRVAVGDEMEIFVDYGDRYENARIRRGYPRQELSSLEPKEQFLQREELEYLGEVLTYTADEVRIMMDFFVQILEREKDLQPEVVTRIILALLLLKKRNDNILEEFEILPEGASICDNGGKNTEQVRETSLKYSRLIRHFVGAFQSIHALHIKLRKDTIFLSFMDTFFEGKRLESILKS